MRAPAAAEGSPAAAGRAAGARVLVAGVGNVFLSDDGFGPEVARRLGAEPLPAGVQATDYGIRGMHLAYDLLAGWDRLILIDLVPAAGRPGDVHILAVDPSSLGPGPAPDPHGMAPHAMLAAVGSLGGELPPITVVGCEPADLEDGIGLSPAVAAAVPVAIEAVHRLLAGTQPVAASLTEVAR